MADEYVGVAERLKRCGLGGVELHGAHGYLIAQILSPWSNRRTDRYGGSLENRVRFVREVAHAIRQTCGGDFVVGSQDAGRRGRRRRHRPGRGGAHHGGPRAPTACSTISPTARATLRLSLENHVPDMHFRRGHFLHIHQKLRPAAAGHARHGDRPHRDAGRGRGGDRRGRRRPRRPHPRADRRRGLARARRATVASTRSGRRATTISPGARFTSASRWRKFTTRSSGKRPSRAGARRRRHDGGASSWSARVRPVCRRRASLPQRGHDVTLLGASAELGGKLAWEAALPGRGEYRNVIAWMERQPRQAGVKIERGHVAGVGDILALNPEHVILATGSHQRRPDDFVGDGVARAIGRPARTAAAAGTAVLFDMDHSAATYAVADALAQTLSRSSSCSRRARRSPATSTTAARSASIAGSIRRMSTIVLAAEPVTLHNGVLTWRNVFTGRAAGDCRCRAVRLVDAAHRRRCARRAAASRRHRRRGSSVTAWRRATCLCAIHEGEAAAMAL